MSTEADGAAAPHVPAKSPAVTGHPPSGYRRGDRAKHGSSTQTPGDAHTMCGSPVVADLIARARNDDERAWDALVERYAPLIWSICRKYRLSDTDAEDVAQSVWLQLVGQLDRIRDPAALPGWLATTTRRRCARLVGAAQGPLAAGYALDAEILPDKHREVTEQGLLIAERHAALREAFADLPPSCQRLIVMLTADPPLPYAEISARLGIPVGSIGPTRARCLDRLRRHPAIVALIDAGGCAPDDRNSASAGSRSRQRSRSSHSRREDEPAGPLTDVTHMTASICDRRVA
jgi:RNA polymerase sigma factor (sigma-70 family)